MSTFGLILIGVLFVAWGILMFFVGANNPPASIRRKIVQKAQDALNKIKNA